MGLLDPQLNKPRTFELLRKKGAIRAELEFSGGHDEGDVNSITLIAANGDTEDLVVWYCGGYMLNPDRKKDDYSHANTWVPMSAPANEDEELSDLLQGPVNERFGSWGGVESTQGVLTWDVEDGTAKLQYSQDEPVDHEEDY